MCLFFLCSCLGFDIGDWPSRYQAPHNNPAANWCGPAGAFCAYFLLYYIGPGVFVVFVSAIYFLGARVANKKSSQPVLRMIGLVLVTAAVSMSFQCLWPERFFGFQTGSGGVLGAGLTQLLRGRFASLGTFILLSAIWIVGVILLADSLILALLRGFGFIVERMLGLAVPAWSAARQHSQVLSEIWRELSARQKPVVLDNEIPELAKYKTSQQSQPEGIAVRQIDKKKPARPSTEPVRGTFVQPSYEDYELPPLDLLAEPEYTYGAVQDKVVKAKASALEQLLSEFSINAHVVAADTGPVVTMFELELAAGVKVSQITALANDMARALGAGAVRVVAPLPGKHTIGIEVPNSEKEKVRIRSMIELAGSKPQKMQIPLYLGKDSSGEALVSDLTKMPHLLIAGTTGSGKSVCINSVITGVLLTKRPDEVKMILIDPKMVEMTAFNTIPHLMCPIVTETKVAVQILEWATVKMDERYALLAEAKVKNIAEFNKLGAGEITKRFNPSSEEEEAKIPKKLPYIV
jgi:S-DNA-T family DNA segregation ATPase FtsK/SpoIIIE